MGVSVCVNEAVCIHRAGVGVSFVGISGDGPEAIDFYRGVAALQAASRPRVALIHEPDLAWLLPPGSADVILSGHTHGGQIALPLLQPLIVRHFTGSHFIEGRYTVNGMPLYVNRGLGFTGLPIRFRSAPELTFVRLAR
jgi:predicted MPP superfamily phosphohydrolase